MSETDTNVQELKPSLVKFFLIGKKIAYIELGSKR